MREFGTTYLEFPDLFPARSAGEAWGEERIEIEVCGERITARGLTAAQRDAIGGRFRPREATADGGLVVRVLRAAPSDFIPIDTRGFDHDLEVGYEREAVRVAGLELMGRIELQAAMTAALFTSAAGGDGFVRAFESELRILLAYRALALDGALLHAAAILHDGGVHLFLGASGAGKSTISRLSAEVGRRVLSDDMNFVRPSIDGYLVEKVPYTGTFAQDDEPSGAWPLRAVHRLAQAPGHAVAPLGTAAATAALMGSAVSVNQDPFRRDALLTALERLARTVPVSALEFRCDPGFWDILDSFGGYSS